jgi:hypothetical protein
MGVMGYIGMGKYRPCPMSRWVEKRLLTPRASRWREDFRNAIPRLELAERTAFEAEKNGNPALLPEALKHVQGARPGVRGALKNAALPEDRQAAEYASEKLNAVWAGIMALSEKLM